MNAWSTPRVMKPFLMAATLAASVVTAHFTLGAEGGPKSAQRSPVTISPGADWLPLEASLDIEPGSALDFSALVPRHAPAGKFGRVVATRQGKFALANRPTPIRFYGVDLCCTAQFLPHELADRLAERLVRLGYNAVRIHHYERWLVQRTPGAVRLKGDTLDQFDYLFAALKNRGIYVTTDLYVSRLVALADIRQGPAAGGNEPAVADDWTFENYYNVGPGNVGVQEYKMAVFIDDRAFENYKAFARALLDHRNPYTKIRYADDTALASLSLMNENCPGNFIGGLKGRLRDQWQRAWNRWLAARYPDRRALAGALGTLAADWDPAKGTVPLQNIRGQGPGASVFNMFLAQVELDFFRRTRTFLRDELGCKTLLTDCNAWTNSVQLQGVREQFDYVDDHFYVDHPSFHTDLRQPPSHCPNTSPIAGGAIGGTPSAFTRLLGKPFTITEFNYCGPGRYRGVGGILVGALGALQDWDGLWRHVYSYSRENIERPAAMYYFDIAADPLNQAAERAAMCLFLRGDLQPATHAVAVTSAPGDLLESAKSTGDKTPTWHGLAWLARVGWRIDAAPKPTSNELPLAFSAQTNPLASGTEKTILDAFRDRGWLPAANRTDFGKKRFQSESGEVTIDAPENVLTLDTPRTAGGFAPPGKRIETRAATIEIRDTDATVWVSSLDGRPIADSMRLLITHLTDLQNTGTRYADRRRELLLAWGRLPHLVRAGRATVTLRIRNAEQAKVHALAMSGKRTGQVPADARNGAIAIPLSVCANGKARMLYEVEIAGH